MANLAHAHVQSSFRTVTVLFIIAVAATLGTALFLGTAESTVFITPLAKAKTSSVRVTIGPEGASTDITGTVVQSQKSATVTATPSSAGSPTPTNARGSVIVYNKTPGAQAITKGARLQAESGVFFRLTNRVDIAARSSAVVAAEAETTGTSGEITSGRLTFVNLGPNDQSVIYAEVQKPFTGGMAVRSGTLGVDELTAASNAAQKEIQTALGSSPAGTFRTIVPDQVGIEPKADVPSSEYKVTVTVRVITATYDEEALNQRLVQSLQDTLADDERIVSIEKPELKFEQQPTRDQLTITATAEAQTAIQPDTKLVQPTALAGRTSAEIKEAILATKLVHAVEIRMQPFWRTSLPADPAKITVTFQPVYTAPGVDAAAR